jgi:FkbM family methyltransferase
MTAVTLRGITMELYEHEAVCSAIVAAGDFYEAPLLDGLRDRFPTQDTIIDAGANIGNHSLYWSAFVPHRRLYAFEPVPRNFDLLSRNLAPYPRALCLEMALSDVRGYLRMKCDEVNMGRCRVDPEGELRVPCATIDDVAVHDNVTLLKVDVEDHERQVLRGASLTIARCHPALLVEDEYDHAGDTLARLGFGNYRETMEWPGANHLWEWVQ